MTRTEIAARARKIVAEHYTNTAGRTPPEITDELPLIGAGTHLGAFADGDLDSLDHMEIVLATEEEFDIEIADDDVERIKVFGDLVEYLSKQPRLAAAASPADDRERCIACGVAFKEGDMVLGDVSGGEIHLACCGPERQGYVKDLDSGETLGPQDPIPAGYAWRAAPLAEVA